MKILNSQQVSEVDSYTIKNTPIASIDLMEQAAKACIKWIIERYELDIPFQIFCGNGNNGGDGLAIARLLCQKGYRVNCYILEEIHKCTQDNLTNRKRLEELGIELQTIKVDRFPTIDQNGVVIDALFGIGLARPIQGYLGNLIAHLNRYASTVVSIDLPSGLFCEDNTQNNYKAIVSATHVLALQIPKLSLFFPENEEKVQDWHLIPIGLDQNFIETQQTDYHLLTEKTVSTQLKTRKKFSHKGTYGHALIVSGSLGQMGAAVLSASACIRSGAGLVSILSPKCGYQILQTTVPEAMVLPCSDEHILENYTLQKSYQAIGMGPGLGQHEVTERLVLSMLQQKNTPMVIDADAINIISKQSSYADYIAPNSILTPHPKEFECLAGSSENDLQRLQKQKDFSKKYRCYVVLKTAHTSISCPSGTIFFNNTGNPGMATAGCGDVLTGIITGLLSQGYSSKNACLIGVYVHGLAADLLAEEIALESITAMQLVKALGKAFKKIKAIQ